MRRIAVLLFWLAAGELAGFAQQFRVATWQVSRVPSVSAGASVSPADEQRFEEMARALESTDADVIILYGVAHSEPAKKLAGLFKQRKYALAQHTVFRHGGPQGPVINQPVTIFSRRERFASKNIEWNFTGRIDLPGGFGFSVFRFGQNVVCLYVAGLPGSLTNGVSAGDGKYFARKRNYAAQFLATHSSWLAGTYTNPVVATYLTGDFQVATKGPVTDDCIKLLDAAGFRILVPGQPLDKSTVSVTNCLEMDRVQDPVFTRGVEFIASRQINRPSPEYPIVVCDLTLKPPAAAAKVGGPAGARPAAAKKPAPAALQPELLLPAPIPAPAAPVAPAVAEALPDLAMASSNPPAAPTSVSTNVSAGSATGSKPSMLAASPANPPVFQSWGRHWLWWLAAGAFGVGLMLAPRHRRRRREVAPSDSRRANAAVYLEIRAPGRNTPDATAAVEGTLLRQASTATGHAEEAHWRIGGGSEKVEAMQARLMPHLRQLMREQVVSWLSRQRATLLKSHELGTQQVLDLQAQLERVKRQFQERMLSQQQRIAELDSALRTKEKLILDLLRRKPPEDRGN